MSARRILPPLLVFVAGLVALSAAAMIYVVPPASQKAALSIGGPFTLVDQDGRPVTERDFAGSPHLVFFGFTHCPDVCPTTLQQISDLYQALGKKGDGLKVAFVTVDPERDTPAALKSYLSSFDPRITGLTGTPDQVAGAIKAYRAYAKKVPGKDGTYTMDHTAIVYVMDANNRFVEALNLQQPPSAVAATLSAQL